MTKVTNYIGQLRIYSLVDLVLLLIAVQADTLQFIGAIMLHLGFLAYLESRHSHAYREKIPRWVAYVVAGIGLFFYRKIEGLLYLCFSFLYTKKNKRWGFVSPFFRGLQNLFLVAGITGYHTYLPYLVAGLFLLRNIIGDVRDAGKDTKEGMHTIPILMGMKKNHRFVHLFFTIGTSILWWSLSPLGVSWLLLAIVLEVGTYHLTPR